MPEKETTLKSSVTPLLGYCHLWQYPTTKQVEAWIVPQFMPWFKALLTPPCWKMCWRGSPCLPIKEAIIWEQSESAESEVTRRREKEELLPWAAALLPYAAECVSWELSDPPPLCIYCILSLSLNNMDSLPWM